MKRNIKVVCVMVTSVNGKSTKGDVSPKLWASEEDHKHFQSFLDSHNLLVMGRKTYEQAKNSMQHKEGKLRIILTHEPEKFKDEEIPGQLEFSNDDPATLVKKSEERGYKTMLLLGGSEVNSMFFDAGLVDELWLTIEPQMFGKGNGLVGDLKNDISLKLESVEKLNDTGTLLLHYLALS